MHTAIEEREAKLFPERDEIGKITCSTLTNEFLIYGTEVGALYFDGELYFKKQIFLSV